MNIFEASQTLRRVEEVMTDLLLCELLGTKPQFVADLCSHLNLQQYKSVSSIRRSVHETSLGETDVEVILDAGADRTGLLVENKVRAVLMPDQLGRYRRRGEDGRRRGSWTRYFVAVFSPASYQAYMADSALRWRRA